MKVLDNVPTLSWERDGQTTYCGALAAALSVTDHPYSYVDLMGLSGLAFRIRWSRWEREPQWCHSCAVGEFPEEGHAIEKATGWRFVSHWDEKTIERFVPQIVEAIDAGRPVLAYEPVYNMAVIYGYQDDGKTVMLRDYFRGDEPHLLPTARLGALIMFLGDYTHPPARRESFVEALRIAVRNWQRGRGDGGISGRDYWYGDAALKAWADDIAKSATFTEEQQQALHSVSTWNYQVWPDARGAAVAFLDQWGECLAGDKRTALDAARELYQQEVELFRSAREAKDAFLGWDRFESWTDGPRERERQILTKAREIESAAIAELEKALDPPA